MSGHDDEYTFEEYTNSPLLPEVRSSLLPPISQRGQQAPISKFPLVNTRSVAKRTTAQSVDNRERADGYDVLMARLALQNSIKKTEQLENRIKRLAFEAQRAQKVTD